MKITGIIAEYDPLHAGHVYQMRAAREKSGADYIVCVTDGAFTQRGLPAMFEKFARVKMALRAGADAVIELPQVYAVRPAQVFARGGVDILGAIGCDCISFGCETDDAELIKQTARLLLDEPEELKTKIKNNLSLGMAYPRALGEALGNPYIEKPNFVLGLEYVKRIIETDSRLEPVVIARTNDYHTEGASAVRALILEGKLNEAEKMLPPETRDIILAEAQSGGISDRERLDALMLNCIRNAETAPKQPDDAEGLMDRVIKLSREAGSVAELIESVKCKRYTYSRIARLISGTVLELPEVPDELPYIRLLGAKKSAAPLLKELNARSGGRLASSASALKDIPEFQAECRATDIWGLSAGRSDLKKAGREYTQKFISM